ncbi:TIR domain-containing protein [Streptomyces sp. WAC05374]|uniref:WD40 domain-containing protein n=2 Tax=Streptomyces sp. WAC05374 TaxID=2487420 RepID=UPI001055F0FD|nr:TIR domain-containing protein [Streptomyces sp. WAC05374]TDF48456.1 TIR domain-containing protein [Streptomyces sp. WAC05374]TDF54988.1 TIR domain-containing protein [Streptomyces sp. WAC05374]TDF55390.1 TIR domain-containing protein [Streptomyces sp. WAC05374]
MLRGDEAGRRATELDFFISYSPADEAWASWIAWTLEEAGYRTVVQAWDFVPGSNFIDFMDRGVSESAAVIAVLSRHYERSTYGRMEWTAALRADPETPERRLLTVRVDDIPVEGLLATITYVDLVGVHDVAAARSLLLARVEQALDGHARPARRPGYPGDAATARTTGQPVAPETRLPAQRWIGGPGWAGRRRPQKAPRYPQGPHSAAAQDAVTVLHLAGPDFGRGREPEALRREMRGDLIVLRDSGAPAPDLLVVTGDLTASGSPRECDQALAFLTSVRSLLDLPPQRVAVVPGAQDVNQSACRAYFHTCEADEVAPQPPYWPKWRHYTRLFRSFYHGLDTVFDSDQPWTLFPVPELNTVVAGFNSSIAHSHRLEDQYGHVGRDQAAWFAEALRTYEEEGWLRIGALRHPLTPGTRPGDADGGPGALDDSATLTELAGPRLHLVLHGPTGGPRTTGTVPSHTRLPGTGADPAAGLPLLGAAAPARFQLLRIAADGITRWYDRGRTGPETFPGTWPRARRIFPAADVPAPSADPEPVHEHTPFDEPPDSLTERVKEVCLARRDGVRLRDIPRRTPGDMAQLMVTWREEGVVRQLRIAVHPGTPTDDQLDRFVAQLHATGPGVEAELVHDGPAPGQALRDRAVRHGIRVRSFLEFQGLLDLRGYVTAQTGRLLASDSYAPVRYLPQRYRDADRQGGDTGAEHDNLVEDLLELLEADHGRFVLLLGDFGHGKTFALRELARRIPEELPHLTPLLIPLNTLDRAHSLEGLVAAHLAGNDVDTIDLRALRYMLAQGRVVLLFDGFDELVNRVSYDRAADHLQVLLDAAVDNAKIVVSSRTQHFKSHEQVLTALGERVGLLPQRRILSVQGFTPDQIRAYLAKTYGDEEAADRRYQLLRNIPDLLALCRNPRLLSFVAQLATDRLRAVAGAGRALSPARLYEDIFTSWLQFEADRGRKGPGSPPGLTLTELWAAVTALAQRLWESGRTALRPDELTDAVADTLSRLTDTTRSALELGHAVGAGSLLVRTDDGLFHFIHGSVGEWLIAREAARRLGNGDDRLLHARPLSRLAVEFLCDLADHERCVRWVRATLGGSADAGETARANAVRIGDRLRVPAHADLRGARLAGEDLSHRDFSGVDLTGADLTDTRLVGANLQQADLTDARLTGARLDRADLRGANLTGADLRRARLTRTDLRDTRLTGSRWHRAALIDPVADDTTRAAPELRTAALAPGMPVDAGFRPSSVGVPYGYGMRTGRLPEPIAYSPDGELLLVGSEDGGVLVCDTEGGRALRTLQGHEGRVYAVKHAPGVIASGGSDGVVRLWDPVSGECRHRLRVHPDGVWPVTLSADGTLVATGDAEGLVTVWDVATGEPVHRLPGHLAPVYTAVFSPDGNTLVTGDAAADVRMWSLATGRCERDLPGHGGAVYRVRYSPDATLIATGDRAGNVRVWQAAEGRLRQEFTGHTGRVYTLDFHPGGRLLVSGCTDGQVRLWDPVVGTPLGSLERCPGALYQVLFSADGKLLAGCDSDGTVRLWTVTSTPRQGHVVTLHARRPTPHRGSAWACAFHPSEPQLLTVGNDGGAQIWDTATGQGKRILRGHGRRVTGVSFSSDGTRLASCGSDGAVRLWDTRTGARAGEELTGRGDRLVSAAFSPVRPVIGTASNDGGIHLWNQDGEFLRELDAETEHIWAQAFNHAGDLLATANDDDTVRLWIRTTGARIATLDRHRGRVRSIAFRADSDVLATGCDDGFVRLWEAREGRLIAELPGHQDRVYGVAFGPGDAWLASTSWDGTAIIWHDGEPRRRLRAGGGKLWTVAAHPSRPVLAAAGDSRTVVLWNADTGARLAELAGHTGRVLSVAFSPDGTALASGAEDGTVRLWNLPPDGGAPSPRATLIGVPGGWAALTPAGGYKYEGDVAGEFWHVVGMYRFQPGELDEYLPGVRRLPLGEEL